MNFSWKNLLEKRCKLKKNVLFWVNNYIFT